MLAIALEEYKKVDSYEKVLSVRKQKEKYFGDAGGFLRSTVYEEVIRMAAKRIRMRYEREEGKWTVIFRCYFLTPKAGLALRPGAIEKTPVLHYNESKSLAS